jgi:uncharacterized protein YjgD (DUF1641 family)
MESVGGVMDPQLDELNRKIDALTAQVAYLAEQAREAELARRSGEELLETAMPIARGAMDLVTTQLEDVQEYLEPDDLIRLLKKVIRHAPQMEMLLDQVDGITDLIDVVGPITKEGMDKATAVVEELDRKGYIAFGKGGLRMLDNIVCNFTENDVDRLGDNIVLILNTVKDMTQPEIMSFVRNTLLVAEAEVQKPVDTSLGSLLKQMNDPAVRRGLALTLRILHVVGAQAK